MSSNHLTKVHDLNYKSAQWVDHFHIPGHMFTYVKRIINDDLLCYCSCYYLLFIVVVILAT